ncbi:hypothetical protein WMY93_029624 [Mugilogobius chulae]|uniref:Ig-like domain-containing protein n=1 Tax=Mugilogobius chulae TaxID=88201 RepID=A0AAW0MM62_9GOBI
MATAVLLCLCLFSAIGVLIQGVSDSGVSDSGVSDSGVSDSGVSDSGVSDSGVSDSGGLGLVLEATQVSCAVGTKCLLPCDFSVGSNAAVHWRKSPGEARVHSFYNNQDQLQNQHQDYRDRTFVFQSQIHRGNASLQLSEVKVQDAGTYVCDTSSNTDSSVSIVDLHVFEEGSELVCSAKGIYPEPEINWVFFTEAKTVVHQREDRLYDITSTVTLTDTHRLLSTLGAAGTPFYLCTVSTAHSSWRTELQEKIDHLEVINNEAVLRCFDIKEPVKSVVWKFNQTQTILTRTGSEIIYNETWRPLVDELTKSGRLVLINLTNAQMGLYSCHISTEDNVTVIAETQLQMKQHDLILFFYLYLYLPSVLVTYLIK